MALFKKLFASADPVATLRKAYTREQWAEVVALEPRVDVNSDPEIEAEVTQMVSRARDQLARINLAEAEAFIRAGDRVRAREHLGLADDQARDPDLVREIARVRGEVRGLAREEQMPPIVPAAVGGDSCAGSCGSQDCGEREGTEAASSAAVDLDLETRLELCLGGYPASLAERYSGLEPTLKQAVVLAHGGEPEALDAFERVPAAERNTDFYYEKGVLLARSGDVAGAVADLQRCLEAEATHPLANDVLFDLYLSARETTAVMALVDNMAAVGLPPLVWRARKAMAEAVAGAHKEALESAAAAYAEGNREPELLVLYGQLLERDGRLDEAERVLAQSGTGGGCGGPKTPVPLAEFWLRHGRQPTKVLDCFKAAWQEDPQNPYWLLRTGQAMLAGGRLDEGLNLLENLCRQEGLPAEILEEASAVLSQNR